MSTSNKASTPKSVIETARKQGARMVEVKFVDTFGTWQHFTAPMGELTEEVFTAGFGLDGSSIRGWKNIEASYMLATPDPATAFIDPFCAVPTLSVTCTIAETGTREACNRNPRGISQRGEEYLHSTGIADTAVFGPEAEFFIFDNERSMRGATVASTLSTARRPLGTRAGTKCRTSATRSTTRKAASQRLRPTLGRTCAPRCS